jgi:hypothetical protein
VTIDAKRPPLADELDVIRRPGAEREETLHSNAALHEDLNGCRVVLAFERRDGRTDNPDLVVQEPPKEIEMVRREIEERAAPGVPPSLPRWHSVSWRRFGVCRLNGTHFANPAGVQNRSCLLIKRVQATVEPCDCRHSATPDGISNARRIY